MRFPGGLIPPDPVFPKEAELGLGELLVMHRGPGRRVDHLVRLPGPQ